MRMLLFKELPEGLVRSGRWTGVRGAGRKSSSTPRVSGRTDRAEGEGRASRACGPGELHLRREKRSPAQGVFPHRASGALVTAICGLGRGRCGTGLWPLRDRAGLGSVGSAQQAGRF